MNFWESAKHSKGKKLLELINELSKVAGYKKHTTQVYFYTLTMGNMQGKRPVHWKLQNIAERIKEDTNKWKKDMLIDLKLSIKQNALNTQSDLQIQCNPYQNPNRIFHGIIKNPKISYGISKEPK